MFPIAGKLTASIRETSFEQFSDGEKRSPFHYTYGMSLFDLLKENPEQKTAFDDYMAGRRQGLRKKWFETFPIDRLSTESTQKPDLVLVVDVAGGSGHDVNVDKPQTLYKLTSYRLRISDEATSRSPGGASWRIFQRHWPRSKLLSRTLSRSHIISLQNSPSKVGPSHWVVYHDLTFPRCQGLFLSCHLS